MAEYVSVVECLRRNGYRHYCNGMSYLERGMTAHARGSFAKAQRNYDKVRLMQPVAPEWFLNALANNITERILNG